MTDTQEKIERAERAIKRLNKQMVHLECNGRAYDACGNITDQYQCVIAKRNRLMQYADGLTVERMKALVSQWMEHKKPIPDSLCDSCDYAGFCVLDQDGVTDQCDEFFLEVEVA